jgi:hypothetical protein
VEPTTVAAIEVSKTAAEKIPFTSLVKAMLGPATDELAERFRDSVRVYRYGRQLRLLEKAEKMATDAGFTPKAVPIKLLFPLLDGASLEENEDLHTMWAALLANAANPDTPDLVHPSYAGTLKQLTPSDANVLDQFREHIVERISSDGTELRVIYVLRNFPMDLSPFATDEDEASWPLVHSLSTLDALGLIRSGLRKRTSMSARFQTLTERLGVEAEYHFLTPRGFDFIKACQPPAQT